VAVPELPPRCYKQIYRAREPGWNSQRTILQALSGREAWHILIG